MVFIVDVLSKSHTKWFKFTKILMYLSTTPLINITLNINL